jgi:hypothetical protein
MAQLWKIRLPNGKTLTPGDWTSAEDLYSTVEVGPGPFPVVTAFSYGRGASVPGAPGQRQSTYADTNLEGEGNRIPENEELIAYSLAIEVFMSGDEDQFDAAVIPACIAPDMSLLNMLRLQRDLLVITRIAAVKEYTRQPLGVFPAGSGVFQYNSAAVNAVTELPYVASNNGGESVCDSRQWASPLYVAGGESLAVDVRPGPGSVIGLNLTALSRARLRLFFEGYRRRPVA